MKFAAVAAGLAGTIALGYLAADVRGALATASALAVLAASVTWAAVAITPRRPDALGTAGSDPLAPFVAYRKIERSLHWAGTSRAHYDRIVRPLLTRLLAARLAERHGIDLAARPDLARALVGAELWPYVDPARSAAGTPGTGPGVPDHLLHRLVDRLEEI